MEEREDSKKCEKESYKAVAKYWNEIPATIDGMLGGFGFLSQTDINSSTFFLTSVFQLENPPSKNFALDCGAGIGRVTRNLLIRHFKHVDLVEQNPKFLETAKIYLEAFSERIGQYFPTGLQNFMPEPRKYDVIWCQWVLGYLGDDDLVEFFKKCSSGLRANGLLIVKENITNTNKLEIDMEDSSVTRPMKSLKSIFERSGLICLKELQQNRFPDGLYPVYMFALKPSVLS